MSSIGGTGDSPGAVAAEVSSDPHAAGRLDQVLAARGLARSRSHAVALIKDGLVTVDGAGVVKPATMIEARNDVRVAGADHYVSRGAHKLIAALDAFALDVSGRDALDLGASTGGFTQVLLERGARSVIALDVVTDSSTPRSGRTDASRSSRDSTPANSVRPRSLRRCHRAQRTERVWRRASSWQTFRSFRCRMCSRRSPS